MAEKIFSNPSIERNLDIRRFLKLKNHPLQNFIYDYELKEEELGRYYLPYAKRPEVVKIKEAPIGITNNGELICIPDEPDVSIGSFGKRGEGKTLLDHTIIDRFYYYFNYLVALLNDYLKETWAWTSPMSTAKFKKQTGYLFEYAKPLPIVLLIPELKDKLDFKRKTPKIKIKIDFQEFVKDIEKFIDLGGSEKYFKNIDFSKCNNWKDVEGVLIRTFNLEKKSEKSVFNKIMAELYKFYDEGVIGFGDDAVIKIKINNDQSVDNPIIQLLKCNVIPSLMTPKLIDKPYYGIYFRYFLDKILDAQNTNEFFQDKRVLVYVEELSAIIERKEVIESTMRAVMQGRLLNIAFMYATQNAFKIPDEILSNTTYRFIFRQESEKDYKALKAGIKLNPSELKTIKELKKFEFYATTSNYFVKYDLINNRKYGKREGIDKAKCTLIPPLSHHLPESGAKVFRFETGDAVAIFNYARQFLDRNRIFLEDNYGKRVLYKDKTVSQSNYKPKINKPLLIEGVDLKKAFFKKRHYYKIIDYEEVKDKGLVIVEKDNFFYFKRKEDLKISEIPYDKLPSNIKAIYYHPSHNRFRLLGKKCSGEAFWLNGKN